MEDIRDTLDFKIERHLQPSEKVWWIGRPSRRFFLLEPRSFFVYPMIGAALASVFAGWCAALLHLNWASILVTTVITFPIFSLWPLLRLSDSWLERIGKTYVITNARVLIVNAGGRVRSKLITPKTDVLRMRGQPNTIEFDHTIVLGANLPKVLKGGLDRREEVKPFAFMVIEDVDLVLELVQKIRNGSAPQSVPSVSQ